MIIIRKEQAERENWHDEYRRYYKFDNLELIFVKSSTAEESRTHAHSDVIEAIYVVDGEVLVTERTEEETLRSGDAALFPPNVPHDIVRLDDSTSFIVIKIKGKR